MSMSKL